MAHELFNNIVIAGNKMRIANEVAREKYLLFSTLSRAAVEAQKAVLNIRAELAAKEAELLDCQTQAMEAQEAYRVKDAEGSKWSSIARMKHLQLMQLGRSQEAFKNLDNRLEATMMVEECLLADEAVQSEFGDGATSVDLVGEEARRAKQLRRKAEEEKKKAEQTEKLRKATEVETLRKAEVARKARVAEEARLKAAAELEAKQRDQAAKQPEEAESNLKKQLNDIQLQKRIVTNQPSNGVRRKEPMVKQPLGPIAREPVVLNEVERAEGQRGSNELAVGGSQGTGGAGINILPCIGKTEVGKDPVPRDSRLYW